MGVLCLVDFPVEEQDEDVRLGIWFPDLDAARFEGEQCYEGMSSHIDACLREKGFTLADQGETAAERFNVARDDPRVDIVGGHPFIYGNPV